jgi:hypothetical protein
MRCWYESLNDNPGKLRPRGIYGSRHVVLMHRDDIDRFGLAEGQAVTLMTAVDDGVDRKVRASRLLNTTFPKAASPAIFQSVIRCCRSGTTLRRANASG